MSSPEVSVEIGALAGLDLHRLRALWQEHYGCDAPRFMSPELLRRALAHRIQEKEQGGLPSAVRARLLAAGASPAVPASTAPPSPEPGSSVSGTDEPMR
jgi:hypothetical protein